jgi:hypothetical protein
MRAFMTIFVLIGLSWGDGVKFDVGVAGNSGRGISIQESAAKTETMLLNMLSPRIHAVNTPP